MGINNELAEKINKRIAEVESLKEDAILEYNRKEGYRETQSKSAALNMAYMAYGIELNFLKELLAALQPSPLPLIETRRQFKSHITIKIAIKALNDILTKVTEDDAPDHGQFVMEVENIAGIALCDINVWQKNDESVPLIETKKVWDRIVHMDEQQWRECDPDEQERCIKRWTEQQSQSVPLIDKGEDAEKKYTKIIAELKAAHVMDMQGILELNRRILDDKLEFAEWIHKESWRLRPRDGEPMWDKMSYSADFDAKTSEQLYELFKNRKQ